MIVSKCFCAAPWHVFVTVCYASVFCQIAFWLDIVSLHVIICRSIMCLSSVSRPPPPPTHHTAGFLIVNIQHVEYLRFAIGAPQTFFRADSVTLNTPHTTWKSDKIIFRSTKITGHYLGLSEEEKSAQNQPDYLLVCTQHYSVLCIFSFK